jgi:hypothetical protein
MSGLSCGRHLPQGVGFGPVFIGNLKASHYTERSVEPGNTGRQKPPQMKASHSERDSPGAVSPTTLGH